MIIYIHGASATAESFAFIREHIRVSVNCKDLAMEYDSGLGFDHNLKNMQKLLGDVPKLFFIAHSLGGIYALHLANIFKEKVLGGVTLSTPYGGCVQADFARYFLPFSKLMKDIGTMSAPMIEAKKLPAPKNWTNIVTTRGDSPWINERNDGVVTLESMKFRKDFELIELDINHYEVVLSQKVVDIILDKINKIYVKSAK